MIRRCGYKTKTWLKFPDLRNNLYTLLYHQLKDSLRENHLNCSFNALGKSFTLGIAQRSATSSFCCLLAKGHAVWVAFIIHRNHKFISTTTKRRQIIWSWFQWSWNWCGYSAECWLRYWFLLFHEADYLAGISAYCRPQLSIAISFFSSYMACTEYYCRNVILVLYYIISTLYFKYFIWRFSHLVMGFYHVITFLFNYLIIKMY